jgi:hypothetical protein
MWGIGTNQELLSYMKTWTQELALEGKEERAVM